MAWRSSGAESKRYDKAAHQEQIRKEIAEGYARRAAAEKEEAYRASPLGQARTSYERGDTLLQISMDLEDVRARVIALEGAHTERTTMDVTETLNVIVAEGWDFCSLSTAFVHEGEQSRDKFLSTEQQVAVRGRLVGTYVFTRRPGGQAVSAGG